MTVSDKHAPLVSILINNYNYGRFLEEAIASALSQDYAHVEVIVVDDGSTDDSRDVIARFGDSLTTVFQPNAGQAAAFNSGYAVSRGDIICLLDADDRFLPHKVRMVVAEYASHPQAQWCFHSLAFFGASVAATEQGSFPAGLDLDVRADMQRGQLRLVPPATSALTFRRELLATMLPMPNAITITSDNYLKFAALGTSVGVFTNVVLAEQRIHSSNAYTLLPSTDRRRSMTAMLIALHLRSRFPSLRRFAQALFASGLAGIVVQTAFDRASWQLASDYLRLTSWSERFVIAGRTILNIGRTVLRS